MQAGSVQTHCFSLCLLLEGIFPLIKWGVLLAVVSGALPFPCVTCSTTLLTRAFGAVQGMKGSAKGRHGQLGKGKHREEFLSGLKILPEVLLHLCIKQGFLAGAPAGESGPRFPAVHLWRHRQSFPSGCGARSRLILGKKRPHLC